MKPSTIALALTFAGLSAPAFAQSADAPAGVPSGDLPDPAADRLSVGVGAGFVPSYEGSNDYVVIPGLVVQGQVDGHSFWTRGAQASFDLIPNRDANALHVELGPTIGARFNRSGRVVDDRVRALGKRKIALEVGGFVGLSKTGVVTSDYDTLSLRVTVVHDVTGIHDSTIVTPSLNYGTPLSRHAYVGLSGSVDLVEDGYARTYFSVTPAGSAASGLPVFSAKGGLKSYTLSAMAARSITGDLTHGLALFGMASYSRLLNDFSASPIVSDAGSPNQWFGAVGVGYTF